MSDLSELLERELDFLRRVAGLQRLRIADREEDKCRQRMRRRGFVVYSRHENRWLITADGRKALGEKP